MRALTVVVWLAAAVAGAVGAGQTSTGLVTARPLSLPERPGIDAIWGATGHDREGRIWFGLSSRGSEPNSAVLVEYDPVADAMRLRGDVVSNLRRSGRGENPLLEQAKIHSRIVQMPDGYLYFASMDESGENPNGSKLPTWGGHLWRARGPEYKWEHLLQTPEALIAVADGGRFVYALGYFNHVLYQFDTRTRAVRSVAVGSAGGHVSRNFFADERGHAYVPRVTRAEPSKPGDRPVLTAALVEFDPSLAEVAVSPLTDYFDRGLDDSHGIVAIHPDGAGGWFFNTAKGRLYQVERVEGAASRVVDRGWFHAGGRRYIASMFRDEKTGNLYGVSYSSSWGDRRFEWVTRSPGGVATAVPLPYGDGEFPSGAVLYGSITRDRMGRFYVVGRMKLDPILLQVTVGQQ